MASYNYPVKKETMNVVIRTAHEKIEGVIYLHKGSRMMDMLNKGEYDFIPVSQAKVYSIESGSILFEAEFLTINKKQIVMLVENYKVP